MRGSRTFFFCSLTLITLIACGEVIAPDTGASSSAGGAGGAGGTASTSAGTGANAGVCTFGQDQTCNDDPAISAILGKCQADGTCLCNPGLEINPSTGHCRPIEDSGTFNCGDVDCKADEFCIERVHNQDAGPVPSTWMCELYFTCTEHTCACAIMSFVSASCISPKCVSEGDPVLIRCDDLN